MKTSHYVFILLLVISVLFVEYDLSRRTDLAMANKADNSAVAQKLESKKVEPVATVVVAQETNKVISKKFAEKFKEEAVQISKIQSDPDLAQTRMKELAAAMTTKDVQDLYEIISDDKNNGDQRALAVELLSIKNDTTSLIALQNFVANDKTINGIKWDRKKEFETILRAQAVESIAAYPQKDIALSTLSYLQHKVDERFLNDRIGRAAANLKDNAPALQQQDDAALKKLLE